MEQKITEEARPLSELTAEEQLDRIRAFYKRVRDNLGILEAREREMDRQRHLAAFYREEDLLRLEAEEGQPEQTDLPDVVIARLGSETEEAIKGIKTRLVDLINKFNKHADKPMPRSTMAIKAIKAKQAAQDGPVGGFSV